MSGDPKSEPAEQEGNAPPPPGVLHRRNPGHEVGDPDGNTGSTEPTMPSAPESGPADE